MYDTSCYELAEFFLADDNNQRKKQLWTEKDIKELAQQIQDTIEDFLSVADTKEDD